MTPSSPAPPPYYHFNESAMRVTWIGGGVQGTVRVSDHEIEFTPWPVLGSAASRYKWRAPVTDVAAIHSQRFLIIRKAIRITMTSGDTVRFYTPYPEGLETAVRRVSPKCC